MQLSSVKKPEKASNFVKMILFGKPRSSESVLCLSTTAFKRSLECQYGLLDHLLQNGCLTAGQIRNLREGYNTEINRNNGLIDLINLSNIDKFEEGLEASNQRHLVNFIRNNGKKTPGDSDWPLRRSDISPIINSYPDLVAHIFTNDLIDQLFCKECLTTEQKNSIFTKGTTEEKNRELLNIVMRRSVRQLDIFYQCLQINHREIYENLLLKRSNETTASEMPSVLTEAERILLIVGLNADGSKMEQKIFEISLDIPDTINVINPTPTYIDGESAACVVSNVLYAVGIGSAFKELWKWSASRDEWTRCADMPSGRRSHCVTSVGDKIYVLGGWIEDEKIEALDSILCYDINSNEWAHAGKLQHAVMCAAYATYKHCAYVFGGRDKKDKDVNYVQIYDTVTRSVSLGSNPMPRGYHLMRAAVRRNEALLIGTHTCFIYDFEINTWQERRRFKTDMGHFGLTLDDNILYISGGGTWRAGVWICTDKVKSLLVDNFILDNNEAEWKHHATLPTPSLIHSYNTVALLKYNNEFI